MSTELVAVTVHKIANGVVARWLRKVGDFMEVDEPLVEIAADEQSTQVVAPVSGVLDAIHVPEGGAVAERTSLASIAVSVTETTTVRRRFGGIVRSIRQAKGWTQEELARRMSHMGHQMHQVTVGKIETGNRPTPIDEVVSLATIFDVQPGDLLRSQGSPKALQELQVVMVQVAELWDQLHQLQAEDARIHSEIKKLRTEHAEAVKRYHTLRRKAGQDAPRLPAKMEAGRRPKEIDRATMDVRYAEEQPQRLIFPDGTMAEVDDT